MPSRRFLVLVWLALLLLLGGSAGLAELRLDGWNTPVNLAIAGIKAGLILWFFMHLRGAAPVIRLFGLGMALWVLILFSLGLPDWLGR